jgi:hypothetical protein
MQNEREQGAIMFEAVEFYDEVERGDYVEILFADGDRKALRVEGVMLRGGSEPTIDVVSTRAGTRFAMRGGDRARIISRGGRRGFTD